MDGGSMANPPTRRPLLDVPLHPSLAINDKDLLLAEPPALWTAALQVYVPRGSLNPLNSFPGSPARPPASFRML